MDNQEAILAIEEEALRAVASGWRTDVEAFKEAVVRLSATVDGHDMSNIIPQLLMMLANLQPSGAMSTLASEGVQKAHAFGMKMVSEGTSSTPPKVPVSEQAVNAVSGLDSMVADALNEAHRNLLASDFTSGGTGAVLAALQPVTASPNKVELATAWAVNTASNEAVHTAAQTMGEKTCWISERDSCVHCQAYNGVYYDNGFPTDLTFAEKPLKQSGPLLFPPLHPRCRCQVEVGIHPTYADALKREAIRSILKGIATETESDRVRVEAAKRLLATDPNAPAAVKKYAERMVKNYTPKPSRKK